MVHIIKDTNDRYNVLLKNGRLYFEYWARHIRMIKGHCDYLVVECSEYVALSDMYRKYYEVYEVVNDGNDLRLITTTLYLKESSSDYGRYLYGYEKEGFYTQVINLENGTKYKVPKKVTTLCKIDEDTTLASCGEELTILEDNTDKPFLYTLYDVEEIETLYDGVYVLHQLVQGTYKKYIYSILYVDMTSKNMVMTDRSYDLEELKKSVINQSVKIEKVEYEDSDNILTRETNTGLCNLLSKDARGDYKVSIFTMS